MGFSGVRVVIVWYFSLAILWFPVCAKLVISVCVFGYCAGLRLLLGWFEVLLRGAGCDCVFIVLLC